MKATHQDPRKGVKSRRVRISFRQRNICFPQSFLDFAGVGLCSMRGARHRCSGLRESWAMNVVRIKRNLSISLPRTANEVVKQAGAKFV